MSPGKRDDYEKLEGDLNPHRAEEQRAAAEEVVARLHKRGVNVARSEDLAELGDLLDAIERFEAAVEAHGGDLMVDDLKSSQPDDSHFVMPRRAPGEKLPAYTSRIHEARDKLRHHPPKPD
jgi:broad specificity phosphatase PhoE